jgi:hypothetical protein
MEPMIQLLLPCAEMDAAAEELKNDVIRALNEARKRNPDQVDLYVVLFCLIIFARTDGSRQPAESFPASYADLAGLLYCSVGKARTVVDTAEALGLVNRKQERNQERGCLANAYSLNRVTLRGLMRSENADTPCATEQGPCPSQHTPCATQQGLCATEQGPCASQQGMSIPHTPRTPADACAGATYIHSSSSSMTMMMNVHDGRSPAHWKTADEHAERLAERLFADAQLKADAWRQLLRLGYLMASGVLAEDLVTEAIDVTLRAKQQPGRKVRIIPFLKGSIRNKLLSESGVDLYCQMDRIRVPEGVLRARSREEDSS